MATEELIKQGRELEQIFKTMEIYCTLEETFENPLVQRFDFSLKDLKDFNKINKIVEIIKICLHKDIELTESKNYHYAIEIKKHGETLDLTTINNNDIQDKLSVLIGVNKLDEPIYFNAKKSIHTLISGATGMGKTSILNNIIYGLTKQNTPQELKLYFIDIKKTLGIWNGLPHLAKANIKDSYDALKKIEEIGDIMESRLEILAKRKLTKATDDMFPRIVVVIDELADLMLSSLKKYIEDGIVHIAQLGRAVNISLIIATQNPIVKVCTTLIKTNCPTRIALKTTSQSDSINILGNKHAFELNGVGEGIMRSAENSTEKRFKAYFLEEDKIQKYIINKEWKSE